MLEHVFFRGSLNHINHTGGDDGILKRKTPVSANFCIVPSSEVKGQSYIIPVRVNKQDRREAGMDFLR